MKQSFALLIFLIASTFASAQTADCTALTHQALELSGVNQSLGEINELLSSDDFLRQIQGGAPSDQFLTMFKPIMEKDFNADLLRTEVQKRMVAHCDPEQMRQAVARMQTPFVVKMLAFEAATNTPEGREKLKRYIRMAQAVPPTDDRMDDLDALDRSTGSSEFAADSVIAIVRGMMAGMGAPADIVNQIQAHRKDLIQQMQNTVEISLSVTYHGVTRPELRQYAKEMSQQPLKGFFAQTRKAMLEVVEEQSKVMGQDLKAQLGVPSS
jgi:hypothetical protein